MELFDGRYRLEQKLGKGAFAEVWRVTDLKTNVPLALKIYAPSTGLPVDGSDLLTHEFSVMVNVSHQNLLTPKYFGICDNRPYLVMQYCSGGNINKLMGKLTERDAWRLLRDAASGLAYLHSMTPPIIHQDVKPDNILIADNNRFMLTDFGVSVEAKATITKATAATQAADELYSAGTLPYMAPERFSKQIKPIMANDIFSLGVTVFELASGLLPFGNHGGLLLCNGADVPELPEGNFSKTLSDVLVQCMSKEPAQRPLASQLESMAQQVLSSLPTVPLSVGEQEENPRETAMRIDSHFRKKSSMSQWRRWLIPAAVVAAVLIGVCGWLLFSGSSTTADKPTVAPVAVTTANTGAPAEQPGTYDEQIGEIPLPKAATTEPQQTASNETEPQTSQSVKPGKTVVADQPVKTDRPAKAEQTTSRQDDGDAPTTLDLGYATYQGQVKNGKPHGTGVLTFRSAHRIDSYDDEQRTAEAGERVEGTFYHGHIDNGMWHKRNGEKEPILIGH